MRTSLLLPRLALRVSGHNSGVTNYFPSHGILSIITDIGSPITFSLLLNLKKTLFVTACDSNLFSLNESKKNNQCINAE